MNNNNKKQLFNKISNIYLSAQCCSNNKEEAGNEAPSDHRSVGVEDGRQFVFSQQVFIQESFLALMSLLHRKPTTHQSTV